MAEALSGKIAKKVDEVIKDDNEKKMILELLDKTGKYDKQTNSLAVKKEFKLLVEQYFPFVDETNPDEKNE